MFRIEVKFQLLTTRGTYNIAYLPVYLICLSMCTYVVSCAQPHHYRFFILIFMSSGISTSIEPPSNLQTSNIRKRRISYRFTASPTSGVTHKVAFIPLRTGIPQPQNKTFHKSPSGSRKMSGLTPDVTYTLQVVAVLRDVESTAISVNFTTKPDGKTAMTAIRCVLHVMTCLYNF